jgi:nucleoside-diphosphate-sugar epimerase
MTVAALRYFTVYGPRQRPGMAINQVLLGASTGIGVPLYGDGLQRREFTYVGDVVAATVSVATARLTAEVINVGGGSSVTMLELLDLARQVTGRVVPTVPVAAQAGDVLAAIAGKLVSRPHPLPATWGARWNDGTTTSRPGDRTPK